MKMPLSTNSLCVHEGTRHDTETGGTVTPVYPGTSFEYLDREIKQYPRYFNTPNQRAVIEKLCALEHAESGLVFGSGMAAISTALLAHLQAGDHAVIPKNLYGGTSSLIHACFNDFGIEYTTTQGLEVSAFEQAIQPHTRVIYLETPSNPLLRITDIEAVAALAKERGVITLIDNTFASPINQNPTLIGIDLVIHSATKYLGGHSDICAGAVVGNSDKLKPILKLAKNLGGSLNAETCYLLERSMKTLGLRVQQQNQNALHLAQFLSEHPQVAVVNYPGLPSHPGYEIAQRQMKGFGGMLSFELLPGADSVAFQQALQLILPSMSLGGVESTICASALTSHAYLSSQEQLAAGIRPGLLRLSVGIEDAQDLESDLAQALEKIQVPHSIKG